MILSARLPYYLADTDRALPSVDTIELMARKAPVVDLRSVSIASSQCTRKDLPRPSCGTRLWDVSVPIENKSVTFCCWLTHHPNVRLDTACDPGPAHHTRQCAR